MASGSKRKRLLLIKQYRSNETIISYPGEIRQVFATLLLNAMQATDAKVLRGIK